MAKIQAAKGNADVAAAMNALVKDPTDAKAIALVSAKDVSWNATLRTTCVATMLEGGHATNALPQRARANINCRIFPGVSGESVREQLEKLVADPEVKVTMLEVRGAGFAAAAAEPEDHGPVREAHRAVFSRRAGAADPAGRRHRRAVSEWRRDSDLRHRARCSWVRTSATSTGSTNT